MRIRKHAKISSLIYTASSSSSSSLNPEETINSTKLVCQLNQSPWDILTFSSEMSADHPALSLYYQLNGNESYTDNGSFNDSNGATESVTSMELDETDHKNIDVCENGDYLSSEHIMKCENNEAPQNGIHTLSPKKQPVKDSSSSRGRGRPRLKKSSACNPDEYYYYSGFGPLWGKKRGGGLPRKNGAAPESCVESNNSNNATASSSKMHNEKELDYVDDDEEDDENGEENTKKRARKPIKARSLKSLM